MPKKSVSELIAEAESRIKSVSLDEIAEEASSGDPLVERISLTASTARARDGGAKRLPGGGGV